MIRKPQKNKRARWVFSAQRTAAAAAVAACFSGVIFSDAVRANPVNPTVVHGTASFATAGNILNITNSPNAIINWGSFSIGVNELTRFIQQSGSSAVLNRVIGQDPSAILGALQSNGRVFIINPNGIVFGAGAQINVAGLVASTLNLSNDDFLNNRMRFTDGAGAGSVVNQGSITGGSVYLIGKAVTNDGLITSPNGEVILAAGNSVELVNPGTPNLRVEIVAPDNEAKNLGTVTADAGRIGIYAGLIQQSGTLRADSAVVEGGRIVLKATKNVHLAAASQTSASGVSGGTLEIQAGDTTIVEGGITATGSAGAGGTVRVLGNLVGLNGHANIDASGDTQGGTVLVGGGFQGKNPDIQNAFRTYVGQDVTIKADAITSGDGGKVIVWADEVTRFYGDVYARGGAQSGNGGFVEVSGKRALDFQGYVNTLAPHGTTGTLLLDPDFIDVTIGGTALLGSVDQFADPGSTLIIAPATISAAATNVVLQANEDINVNDAISMTNNGVGITMRAGGFLNVFGGITTRGGAISLSAGDAGSLTGPNEGALYISAPLNTTAGGFIGGANITLSAPISDVGGNSVYINTNVNAGASGTVNITGQRLDHVGGTITGAFVNVSTTSAGNGDITLSGGHIQTLGGGNVYLESDRDIKMTSGSTIVATGGVVSLHSDSDGNDEGFISINNGVINAPDISMTGGNGYAVGNASNPGISITNNSQIVGNGSVDLRGSGSTIAGGYGVLIDTSTVENNIGSTYVEGIGGVGTGYHGVKLAANASIMSPGATGSIEVIGSGTGSGADGVYIGPSSGIFFGGSGDIRVTGSGSGGGQGINMQGTGTSFIGGTSATQIFLNSLSGGMTLDGAVTACQSCGSITLKSSAGATATTAALTASGLRVLGTGTFNIDSNSNSLETVAAFLSGGPNLLHVHDSGDMQVGLVTSYDGVGFTTTTGVNVGISAGNVVDLHTAGALQNGTGTVTAGGQIILDAASIGASGTGNYIGINRGATGTASLTSSSGGIFVEQVVGSGSMPLNQYTFSAPSGQTVALASSGGPLIVNTGVSIANDLKLYTTGANDIQFNAAVPLFINTNSLTLEPATGRSVLFNTGVGPWSISSPVTVGNNAAVTIGSGQNVDFVNAFNTTGTITVGAGSTLNLGSGAMLTTLNTAGNVSGGPLDIDALIQTGGAIFVSSLNVNNSFSQSAGTITGTSGNVELNQTSGNLTVRNASAYGRFKAVAASGDLVLTGANVSSANGPVELFASGNIDINGGSYVNAGSMSASNIQMVATSGGVTIQNASVNASYGGPIDITAATGITVSATTQATSITGGNVTLTSGGNVNVLGGGGGAQTAVISGSGITTVNASGDVMVTGGGGAGSYAEIYAADDVFMTVGGTVHLDDGLGAGAIAKVVSGSPTSIHLNFANLASGGYFVNGVEGAITDVSGSGFYAGGPAAVLDTNLIVTYGMALPPGGMLPTEGELEVPEQTLIVALAESTEPPDAEKEKDVFKETEDDKKKDAPVCK